MATNELTRKTDCITSMLGRPLMAMLTKITAARPMSANQPLSSASQTYRMGGGMKCRITLSRKSCFLISCWGCTGDGAHTSSVVTLPFWDPCWDFITLLGPMLWLKPFGKPMLWLKPFVTHVVTQKLLWPMLYLTLLGSMLWLNPFGIHVVT